MTVFEMTLRRGRTSKIVTLLGALLAACSGESKPDGPTPDAGATEAGDGSSGGSDAGGGQAGAAGAASEGIGGSATAGASGAGQSGSAGAGADAPGGAGGANAPGGAGGAGALGGAAGAAGSGALGGLGGAAGGGGLAGAAGSAGTSGAGGASGAPGSVRWARALDVRVNALAVNGAGDLIAAGSVGSGIDVGCGVLETATAPDALVASFHGTSGSCRWSSRFGAERDDQVTSIALEDDVVHVGGSFRSDTIDFGAGPIEIWNISAGSPSPFLATFEDTGTGLDHVRSRRFDGRGAVDALSVASSLFVGGTFYSAMSIDGHDATTCCPTFDGMYVGALDATLAGQWMAGARAAPPSNDNVWGWDLAVAGERVFVAGSAEESTTSFGDTLVEPPGSPAAFLAAYTTAGELDWVNLWGLAAARAHGLRVIPEPGGTVLFAGVVSEGTDLGKGPLTSSNGYGDHLFVMRVDATGTTQALATLPVVFCQALDLALRSDGSVIVLANYRGTLQIAGATLESAASGDVFLAQLSPDLSTWQHAEHIATPHDDWNFSDVAVLPDDSIALAIDFIDWIELRGERYTGFDRWATLLAVVDM